MALRSASLLLLGFALTATILAAEPAETVRFRDLTVADGLSHTTVWDIEQDLHGFIWIATESSLQRSFQEVPPDRFGPRPIPASTV